MGALKNIAKEGGGSMESYCLFCKSGQEGLVIDLLTRNGYAAFSPLAVRNKPDAGGIRRTKARLLPGYVFFDADCEPDWETVRRYSGVLKVLRYEDGSCALRGDDLAFVKWLRRYEGMIDVSQVVKVGTKIAFVGGPLVGMEARVLKVNKSRKTVQIALGDGEAMFRNIWCTIEYIGENVDIDLLHQSSEQSEKKDHMQK
jgi:transcription antitermination factor NusG